MKVNTIDFLILSSEEEGFEDTSEKKKTSEKEEKKKEIVKAEKKETKKILKYIADTKKKLSYMKGKYFDTQERFIFTVDQAREIIGYKVKTWKPPKWNGYDLWYASEEQSRHQQCIRTIKHTYDVIQRYSYGSRSRL